ncbi:uncharacterized protein LOC135495850 [Lineus longissimus]|uniref:uncharacterized protein LOC135495850 n=1 Tax=Lineus longissimus TaxID=88925 RepID=UPI002B4E854C
MVSGTMSNRASNPDGVEKAGFIDVKFPAKSKGKRGWVRRWVVIVKLRVESSDLWKCCAKVDFYPDEDSWRRGKHADRRIMENVSVIMRTPSSTHAYAFHVDGDAPLSMAGQNETETQDWMRVLRTIFMPKMRRRESLKDGTFEVSVIDNPSSKKKGLNGDYLMSIKSKHINLIPTSESQEHCEWELSMIRSFSLTKGLNETDKEKVLDIVSGPFPNQGEAVYRFYCLRARELLKMIWTRIQYLMDNGSNGEVTPATFRSRASTDSNTGSEYSSRTGTPTTRQSAFAAGVPPEELRKRMVDHQSWSHGYDTLTRTYFKRQTSDMGPEMTEWKSPMASEPYEWEDEDPYSHIGEQSDDELCSSDDQDGDFEHPVHSSVSGLRNNILDGPKEDPPPPLPPSSPRCKLRLDKDKGRAASDSSNASKSSSRDSGILNPTSEAHPSILEESHERNDWRHHDSVDSAYSSSTRRGSNEPGHMADLDEQTTDTAVEELLRQSINANVDEPISHSVQDFESSSNTPFGDSLQDDENIYEELSKQRCSYRKNLMSFLGAEASSFDMQDAQGKNEALLSRRGSDATMVSSKKGKKMKLSTEQKKAEIRTILKAMGKSEDEDDIYEDLDQFLKKKDLSKIFGEDFDVKREGVPDLPTRPKSISIQRSTSQIDAEKPKRFRKFKSMVKKLRSPLGSKGEHLTAGLGSDSSLEEDPQREANAMLQHLEGWPIGSTGSASSTDSLLYATPPLPKPRTSSASVAIKGSPMMTRERKRSKSHPHDSFVKSAGLVPAVAAEETTEPLYDIPRNNTSIENVADSENLADDTKHRASIQSNVSLLMGGDNDYEDLTEPLSPFQPFQHQDPFNIAKWKQSNRIQSEPDLRERDMNSIGREAVSMPASGAFGVPPPLPASRVSATGDSMKSDQSSYNRSTSFELNISDIARPISIFDGSSSSWLDNNPMCQVSSPEEDCYSFDNSEYIIKNTDGRNVLSNITESMRRKSYLSDISESERSRQGSFTVFSHEDPGRRNSEFDASSSLAKSRISSGMPYGYDSDESSDYVDMSGLCLKKDIACSDTTYVSMDEPFMKKKESDC